MERQDLVIQGRETIEFNFIHKVTIIRKTPDEICRHDFDCGLHSGLPLCCVMFFSTCWHELQRNFFATKILYDPYYNLECTFYEDGPEYQPIGITINYIMCPDHVIEWLAGRYIPILPKSCNCSKSFGSDIVMTK